jgi:hypothetical protein
MRNRRPQVPPQYVITPHLERAAATASTNVNSNNTGGSRTNSDPLHQQQSLGSSRPAQSTTIPYQRPIATGGANTSVQESVPTGPPRCVICEDRIASEALLCGHLVSCTDCLEMYKANMDSHSRNRRCPVCRRDSNGVWVHIYGLNQD